MGVRIILADVIERSATTADGCWPWAGRLSSNGYGLMGNGSGRALYAHRVVYERLVGPIPSGLCLDHLCRNPPCVNPAHLEPVTIAENTMRGFGPLANNARKTACPAGHPYDEQNTLRLAKSGWRECRVCRAGWRAKEYANRRQRVLLERGQ